MCVFVRDVGLSRQRPDAAEVSVHHDEERSGARRSEEEVEVAADPAEQGGRQKVLNAAQHHFSQATLHYERVNR